MNDLRFAICDAYYNTMLEFILTNVFILSGGTMLYLVIRALPRLDPKDSEPHRPAFVERLLASHFVEKVDAMVSAFLEKLLRRAKVVLMKFDNLLSHHLKKIKSTNGKNGSLLEDFKKLSENREE
jgi:hypothetical protein